MVDRNIVNKLGLSKDKLDKQVNEMFGEKENEFLEEALQGKVDSHLPGAIIKGKIVSRIGNDVIVEVGLKSEGVVDENEFDSPDEIVPGKEIEVLLEDADSEGGLILLSKRKADRIRNWEEIINTKKEGDVVTGRVIRRIKGGLLVDIGVPVFLPASQVDIRKPGDISRFIGKEVQCRILKIDVEGRNIVISRRKLIEEERRSSKEKLMAEIEPGQLRKGIVKNIADFGVFVDLGGLDGLLHISDLSWGRILHPSEVVKIDQEIECVVIDVDKENEKVSLGLKQKTASPWETVEENYPIGTRVRGKVVNLTNYGVFVRFEDGIEGLVHISEMSWTRRLNHPSEILSLNDEIEVVVLNVNKEKQEISLGLKQTETNPWTVAAQKYPAGTVVTAEVRSVTNFGAFVEIEEGIDGMIHISDLSWTRKYGHPSELLQKGNKVKCVVLDVNEAKQRISLGIKQLTEDPWVRAIPEKYIPGHIIKGVVTKITNFGAFVELEPDLEGLLHISELADHKIDKPQDVVKEDDEIEVKILKVDTDSRKIGLSLRRARWAAEEQAAVKAAQQQTPSTAEEIASDADTDRQPEPKEQAGEPAEAKPVLTEPAEAEPAEQAAEPAEAETVQAEPSEQAAEPAEAEPAEQAAEPAEAETAEAKPVLTEPAEQAAEPAEAEPAEQAAEPAEAETVQAEPGEQAAEPAETEPGDVKKPEDTSKPKSKRTPKAKKTGENTETDKQTEDDSTAEENTESDTDN